MHFQAIGQYRAALLGEMHSRHVSVWRAERACTSNLLIGSGLTFYAFVLTRFSDVTR